MDDDYFDTLKKIGTFDPPPSLWERFKHIFGIHVYYYDKRLSENSHLLICPMCLKRFLINTSQQLLIDWDLELHDFYSQKNKIMK